MIDKDYKDEDEDVTVTVHSVIWLSYLPIWFGSDIKVIGKVIAREEEENKYYDRDGIMAIMIL